jgi:hypothetical protein
MSLPRAKEDGPRFLLVEGPDDQGVVLAMLAHCRIENVYVGHREGYDTLRRKLRSLLDSPGRTHFGVIVDADEDLAARWRSVCDVLRPMGYALPDAPEPEGTICEAPFKPRLGLWLMPDNLHPGMVEDFVSALAPSNDALLDRARESVAGIPLESRRFKPTYRIKAEIHTWLAWQEEPGRPMGQAITKTFLDANSALAVPFRMWLSRLFG